MESHVDWWLQPVDVPFTQIITNVACSIMLIYWIGREEDANDKVEKKEKMNGKAEDKVTKTGGDDSGSDKEIVKEWRTRSRGLEKGAVIFFFKWPLINFWAELLTVHYLSSNNVFLIS